MLMFFQSPGRAGTWAGAPATPGLRPALADTQFAVSTLLHTEMLKPVNGWNTSNNVLFC